MSSRTGFLLSVTVAAGALIGTASARATAAAAPLPLSAAQAQEADPGERIMNGSCQGCHDLRTIQTAAKTPDEWTATINTMVDNGAEIEKDDIPVLVKYLAFHHGPMPDGAGKSIVLNTCTMCHDLARIKFGRRSAEEWEETLISMLNEGAPLSDADFAVVHEYLSRNFGIDDSAR